MELSRRREKLVGRLRSRKTRAREAMVLVEGLRVAREVLDADVEVRFAVAAREFGGSAAEARLLDDLESRTVDVARVPSERLAGLSDTETPQGILLVCPEPAWTLDDLTDPARGRYLILDAVQDPGNLGTLVRAARAFAVDAVVGLDGTVDPWNPKAVRAAAGASFRVPLLKAAWDDVAAWTREEGVRLLAAEAGGGDVARAERGPPWALAVGNEGAGVRSAVLDASTGRVAVPMPGGAESLNVGVAGAILLYELTREPTG